VTQRARHGGGQPVPRRVRTFLAPVAVGIAAVLVTTSGVDTAHSAMRPQVLKVRDMPTDTAYKGRTLHLTATRNSDGTWTGTAHFPDEPGRIVKTDKNFSSEEEALSAALSQAMAVVDRDRMSRGKP
jgi:hypothetical protein